MDFSPEKIATVAAGIASFFVLWWLNVPFAIRFVILIIILGWGAEIYKRLRR